MPSSKRLISQFNPDNYHLELDLDKKNKRFSGKLIINGYKKHKPSYRFTFNQLGLKVTSARIVFNDKKIKKEIEVTRIVHHKKLQELRLHTKEQVKSGKYAIELEYSGKVSTKGTNGFYTSSWLDKKSNQKEILTTQFEPHYARQLLPCIDEPEAKAFFNLQLNLINSSTNEVTLFNTPIKSSSHNNGLRTVRFNTTPKMSTYLLALIVGELKSKENKVDNTLVRVFTTPDKVSSVDFALEFASKSLKFLEEKFGMSYPLEKLDLVAVPDFDAGGMENWGLLTFREDLLLFDKDSSTLADKQMIALIIAHEVAHQWFGNLVTMKWWDELWLKEGFANFIEYYTVDNLYPEWNILEQYLITEKNYAIRMDSLLSSRPIVNKVKAPHHAVDAFDSIAYEKSGSVIRMLFSILREENFLKGLKDYFEKYKFSSATSKDLLLCWQRYTSVDLIKFTEKWLVEPGLPKVDLSVGKNSKQIVLRQSEFLSEDEKKDSLKKIQNDAL
ncbi:MAG TPA: M1 family metallopeptidase, partial [Candidatus Saccharimonadales bacterium]|nr:M1 family metallopeptidase [Candidatus Saccharimonadales bacterium]